MQSDGSQNERSSHAPPKGGRGSGAANTPRSIAPITPVIPDHEVLRLIGQGSYGEVWLARTMMGKYRAVKVVYRNAFNEPRPFERELAGIKNYEPISRSHEGFVDVLHIGQGKDGDYFYYIMELADDVEHGQEINPETYQPHTLQRKIYRQGRLSFEECVQLGLSLSQALHHLHRKELVHRDIKPSNIIFVNGTPKLADIGLISGIDETYSWVGTHGYIAPEGPGQPPADVYGLGKVLYECATGEDRSNFPHLPTDLAQDAYHEQFQELNEIFLRACDANLRRRYSSAEQLHADLAFVLNGHSVRRLRALERRWLKFRRAAVGVALVLLAMGMLAYPFVRERSIRIEHRQRQIGAYVANGLHDLEAGQLLQSLPSLVGALSMEDPARAAKHRLRLGMILEQCPKLLQLWLEPGELADGQFSADGQWAVLASQKNKAVVKNVQTGELLGAPFGPTWYLEKASFSPDGKLVLTACQEYKAELWNWRTGNVVLTLNHPNKVHGAKFNPRGDRIATACSDKMVRLWDAKTGELLWAKPGHTQGVLDVTFSHDGTKLVSVGQDSTARLWDAATGDSLDRTIIHKSWVYSAAFSPDDRRLITACYPNAAHVYDVASGQEVLSPLVHLDAVSSAAFSPDGRLILTGSWDSTARLWDAATGRPAHPNPILPHSSRVRWASFHPDGHRILTVCLDGSARLWDLAGAIPTPTGVPGQISFRGTNFCVQSNRWVELGETKTNRRFGRINIGSEVRGAALNASGAFVLTLSHHTGVPANVNELAIWQSATGEKVFSLASFSDSLSEVALSDSGRWFVCWKTNQNQALVYDLSTVKPKGAPLLHSRAVGGAFFSPQGDQLVILSRTEAYVWNLRQEKLKYRLTDTNWLQFVSFSQDGRLLLTGARDDRLTPCAAQVWRADTGQPVGPLLPHRDGVCYGSFSPDGWYVVTAGEDFTAYIWNFQDASFKSLQHADKVWDACFSPNGTCVLTICRDGSARLWDAETGEPLSPPLPHGPLAMEHGIFLGNDFFVASGPEQTWLWSLTWANQPVEDLRSLAQVLACKGLSPQSANLQPTALQAAWQRLKAKYPAQFQTSPEQLAAWRSRYGRGSKAERP